MADPVLRDLIQEIVDEAQVLGLELYQTPTFKDLSVRGAGPDATSRERSHLIQVQMWIQGALWGRSAVEDAERRENSDGEEWKRG